MPNPPQVGLLTAGRVDRYGLMRVSRIMDQLGPVKSTNIRGATRIANSLNAGFGVRTYDELCRASVIVIDLPPLLLGRFVEELCHAKCEWDCKTMLLWSLEHDSRVLEPLARRGAQVASFHFIPNMQERWFVLEGSPRAAHVVRTLLRGSPIRLLRVKPETKALFQTGLLFADRLVLMMLQASTQTLQQAGVSRREAGEIAAAQGRESIREYYRAGANASRAFSPEALAKQQESLIAAAPDLIPVYRESVHLAERLRSKREQR